MLDGVILFQQFQMHFEYDVIYEYEGSFVKQRNSHLTGKKIGDLLYIRSYTYFKQLTPVITQYIFTLSKTEKKIRRKTKAKLVFILPRQRRET